MELVEGHRPIDCPAGVPLLDVDPYDPEILRAPEAFYAELRALGPVDETLNAAARMGRARAKTTDAGTLRRAAAGPPPPRHGSASETASTIPAKTSE